MNSSFNHLFHNVVLAPTYYDSKKKLTFHMIHSWLAICHICVEMIFQELNLAIYVGYKDLLEHLRFKHMYFKHGKGCQFMMYLVNLYLYLLLKQIRLPPKFFVWYVGLVRLCYWHVKFLAVFHKFHIFFQWILEYIRKTTWLYNIIRSNAQSLC